MTPWGPSPTQVWLCPHPAACVWLSPDPSSPAGTCLFFSYRRNFPESLLWEQRPPAPEDKISQGSLGMDCLFSWQSSDGWCHTPSWGQRVSDPVTLSQSIGSRVANGPGRDGCHLQVMTLKGGTRPSSSMSSAVLLLYVDVAASHNGPWTSSTREQTEPREEGPASQDAGVATAASTCSHLRAHPACKPLMHGFLLWKSTSWPVTEKTQAPPAATIRKAACGRECSRT